MDYAEKQEAIVSIRRRVMAMMETGQHGAARTLVTELREYDLDAAFTLRADVVRAYGIDL